MSAWWEMIKYLLIYYISKYKLFENRMSYRLTQHEFLIDKEHIDNYFQLLNKYYAGIESTVIFEDIDSHKSIMRGRINLDWLQNLPKVNKYYLLTDPFPSNYATIRTFPPIDTYLFTKNTIPKHEKKLRKMKNVISNFISTRLEEEKYKYLYIKYPFTNDITFVDLLKSLHSLKNIDHITRCLINYQKENIILVLDDLYPIGLTTSYICDASLPSFDIEEGFSFDVLSTQWVTKEWKRCFKDWHRELVPDYSSWDEPIFPPDYTWSMIIDK